MAQRETVLIRDACYSGMDAPVEAALEASCLDFHGKTVLLKPNMAAQCPPDRAATTHPSLIASVIKALVRRGTRKIMVGDNPGATAYGINEKCARTTGILDAAGDHYVNFSRRPRTVRIDSPFLETVNLSSEFFECDTFINLPKLKAHCHAFLSACVKNLYGICVGGEKSRLHALGTNPKTFAEILVDVFQTRIPDLNIVDGVVGMEGNGPTNGKPRQVGKIVAGTNAFAVDAVCADMVGFRQGKVLTLRVGEQRGLWSGDLSGLRVEGTYPRIGKFQPPVTFGAYTVFNRIMSPYINCLPVVDVNHCKRCGTCASVCPVGSCTQAEGQFPKIESTKCIKCYCCQEFCPQDAVRLTGRMFRLTGLMAGIRPGR